MVVIEKESLGKCPNCNSEYINWKGSDLQDEFVVYSAQCMDCGVEFCENYKLVYEITTFEKE